MRPYEVMIIFDVDLEEADIQQQVERVLDLVKSHGGTTGKVDYWGRRTFAYELKHRTEGYYAVLELVAEPPTVAEADRLLALEDSVLRHKVIRLPEHVAGRARSSHRRQPASRNAGRSSGAGRPSSPSAGGSVAQNVAAGAAENVAAGAAENVTGTSVAEGAGDPSVS